MNKGSSECLHVSDWKAIGISSGDLNASEAPCKIIVGEHDANAVANLEGDKTESSVIPITENLNPTMGEDIQPFTKTVENSNTLYIAEPIKSMDSQKICIYSNNGVSEVTSNTIPSLNLVNENVMDSLNFMATAVSETCLVHHDKEGSTAGTKPSIEFSLAARMLMGKVEENQSVESKERFRQRLWCYLFENLNRAIDELYFLCELECDMEQIQEALLVLKEAGLDFNELKSRVEGFEKVKKQPSASQILFGGNLESPFAGKVEHRRPHAIAWEVIHYSIEVWFYFKRCAQCFVKI